MHYYSVDNRAEPLSTNPKKSIRKNNSKYSLKCHASVFKIVSSVKCIFLLLLKKNYNILLRIYK